MAQQISAIDIKKVWYAEVTEIKGDLTAAILKTLLAKAKEVVNIHQDTWSLEEAESSQDSYKNQLTGSIYRQSKKTMGDITLSFTIGQYDYQLKQELMGGTATDKSWKRQRGPVYIYKSIIALTTDGVYIVFPYCSMTVREANSDGALGMSVTATIMEPKLDAVSMEYWFDAEDVEAGA